MTTANHSDAAELVAALPAPDTIADPYPVYDALRPQTPVYGYQDYPPGTVPGQDEPVTAWVLMKYDEVAQAARDHDTFSSRDPLQEQSSAPTLMLVNHDNPEHDRLRRLVSVAFSRREVSELKPWILAAVHELLDAVGDNEVEVVSEITSVLPARVMMKLFGQPDADAMQCRDWAQAFMLSADLSPEARQASNESMVEYFTQAVMQLAADERAGKPLHEGLIPAMLVAESDGERLTLEEVIRFCVTLVVAGAETTTFLLANLLDHLAAMPDIRRRLIDEPSRIAAFIDESLRHSGPPQRLFRVATRDVTVGDKEIRAGDWVALFFAAANHDPAVFPQPTVFDLDRQNLNRQLSMGAGIHHCLGFAVAKLEATALVEAVLERFPNLTSGDTPPVPQQASLLTKSWSRLYIRFRPEQEQSAA